MNIPDYLQALFPAPYIVLGVKLKRFSVGDYTILRSVDSPFLDESRHQDADYDDLLFAFAVCTSKDYDEADALVGDYHASKKYAEEMEGILIQQSEKLNLRESIDTMQEYIDKGFKIPLYSIQSNDTVKESGTFWLQSVILTLTSELGYTRQEVFNTPMSQAISDYLWQLEKNGSVRILPEYLIKMIKESKEKQ